MIDKLYNLDEFKDVSKKEWFQKIEKDLKGKNIESLNWELEGMQLSPFFGSWELSDESILKLKPSPKLLNLQRLNSNAEDYKDHSLEALNNGADGIISDVTKETNFNQAFSHIFLEHCHFCLESSADNLYLFENYKNYLSTLQISKNKIHGLGFWNETLIPNVIECTYDFNTDLAYELINQNEYSNFRNLYLNTGWFDFEKYAPSSEIALSLSMMIFAINELLDKGLKIDKIVRNLFFKMKSNSNYFPEIAKIRALKVLLKTVLKEYEYNDSNQPYIHIEIDKSTNFQYLEPTTKAMSCLIGGVNSINVISETKTSQDTRIARNIVNILKEESYLDKAIDPSQGSYLIETLTKNMADQSWNIFTSIEKNGGIKKCVENGKLVSLLTNKINQV